MTLIGRAGDLVASSRFVSAAVRRRLYRRLGLTVGDAGIRWGCRFIGSQIEIGDRCWIHHGVFIDGEGASVRIGADVAIGPEVMLLTSSHHLGPAARRGGPAKTGEIVVGDGCWLGARAVVLPGVTIGAGCLIAAGTVVSSDCEPNGLYAGVPARRTRDLDEPR
jgi:maltose O-acetyltransferase